MGITAGDSGNIMVGKTGSATIRPFNLYVNSQNGFGSIRVGRSQSKHVELRNNGRRFDTGHSVAERRQVAWRGVAHS